MDAASATTDSTSRTAVLSAASAACCTNEMSFVSFDTRRPGVSRVSRARSDQTRCAKASSCMSVVMRMTMRLVSTVCR